MKRQTVRRQGREANHFEVVVGGNLPRVGFGK